MEITFGAAVSRASHFDARIRKNFNHLIISHRGFCPKFHAPNVYQVAFSSLFKNQSVSIFFDTSGVGGKFPLVAA